MKKFNEEIKKEIILLFTIHNRAVWMMIFVPVLYTMLYGGLFYQNLLTKVPMVICNLDEGSMGRGIVYNFIDTHELQTIKIVGSYDEMESVLLHEEAEGAIIIPPDFSKKIGHGQSVSVEVIANNANTLVGGTIARAAQSVIGNYNVKIAALDRIAAGLMPNVAQNSAVQIESSSRSLYNSTGGYIDFFLGVLIVHALQIGIVFVVAPMMVYEKKRRREKLFKDKWRCLSAKLIVYMLVETVTLEFCLALAMKIFGMNCQGNILDISLLILVFSGTMTSFAMFVGAWLKKATQSITYPLFYVMPSVLFSGAIWPRASMDKISLGLSYIMPIGYAADDLRDLLVRGVSPTMIYDIGILSIYGVIFFLFAGYGLKRSLGAK